MNLFRYQPWVNLLTLLPGTSLTLLTIAVAFLRFYNEEDFYFLGYLAQPRVWSNRLTVAALLVAVVNIGVEWNLRNRETDRLAQEEQRRTEKEQRATEARERAARRARIQNRWIILQIQHQLAPREETRAALGDFVVFLQEYGESGVEE
ncbi:MAG: hypothetical protein KGQ93_02820 [Cyanobacteria bacterium REEB459]|nr:hypothetical protein [Cyanobacteria bacterium REEB459]